MAIVYPNNIKVLDVNGEVSCNKKSFDTLLKLLNRKRKVYKQGAHLFETKLSFSEMKDFLLIYAQTRQFNFKGYSQLLDAFGKAHFQWGSEYGNSDGDLVTLIPVKK